MLMFSEHNYSQEYNLLFEFPFVSILFQKSRSFNILELSFIITLFPCADDSF